MRAALLAIFISSTAVAAPTVVRTIEGVTEYRLSNGMQALLVPDASIATATIDMTVNVGTRHEGLGETGMAHLLEHLVFKGSPRHRGAWKLLEQRGASDQNGQTGADRTHYFTTLPATQANVDYATDLYADLLVNASISDADLATEVTVVRNEVEEWDSRPSYILETRVKRAAFTWHPYGRSVYGAVSDLASVPGSALRAFYKQHYQPDNATVTIGGRFDVAATLATLDRTFGAIPRPTRKLATTYTVEPEQDGERRVTLERAGDGYLVQVAYHGVAGAAPEYAALGAATSMLVREPGGRLYDKLVAGKLASSVTTTADQNRDPYLATFTAVVTDPANLDRVEAIMTSEIEKLATTATAKDLERWRVAEQKAVRLGFVDTTELVTSMADWISLGDWRTVFAYRDRVATVTLAEVAKLAKAYFVKSNRTVGRFVPVAAPVRAPPTTAPDPAMVVRVVREGGAATAGEAFVATLENVEARAKAGKLGDIATLMLPKQSRGGKVHLELALHWGEEKALADQEVPAQLLGALFRRGTKKKSFDQLRAAQDAIDAELALYVEADGMVLTIDGLRDHLGPALALATEMLTEPALAPEAFEIARRDAIANLEDTIQDPETAASTAYAQLVSPYPAGDPRRTLTPAEEIQRYKRATLAEVTRFYTKFAGASRGELVVVGDFAPGPVGDAVAALAKRWPSKAPYVRLPHKAFGVAAARKEVALADRANAYVYVGQDIVLRADDPGYAAMTIANRILGRDYGSRLFQRVREREGLSYGVGSWLEADPFEAVGAFATWAEVAPRNLAKAEAALVEEYGKLATGAVTADEVAAAKQAALQYRDALVGDDRQLAGFLRETLRAGHDIGALRKRYQAVAAVTPADIAAAVKKLLDPKRLSIVVAVDPTKR